MTTKMKKYPTRPLEFYDKMIEVRGQIAKDTFSARERGKVLVLGGEGGGNALYSAFNAEVIPAMPTGRDMRDLKLLGKFNNAAEAKGFSRDCCSTLRIALGAFYMGQFAQNIKTGENLKPDIAVNIALCQGQIKSHQIHSENFGIPVVDIEMPLITHDPKQAKKHFIQELNMAIEKMEKALGRKCDDEKLIEGTINEWRVRRSMSEIAMLQKTIPAPLKTRNLGSLLVFIFRGATYRSDVADLIEFALEDVKERVKDGIAAFENERFRLLHEGNLPWFPVVADILRYPEKFGGVYVGGLANFAMSGCYSVDEDGHWETALAPWERGREIKTREDALDETAGFIIGQPFYQLFERPEHRLSVAIDWKIDGAVLGMDRGCVGVTSGLLESANLLKENGILSVCYETSSSVPSDFDRKGYERLMDRLMESLEGR